MALRHALEMTQDREPERIRPASTDHNYQTRIFSASKWLPLRRGRGILPPRRQFGTIWQQKGLPAAVSLSRPGIHSPLVRRVRSHRFDAARLHGQSGETRAPKLKQTSPLLIGYIDAQLGIGQSLRGLAFALPEAGTPFSIYPFGVGVEGRRSIPTMPERYDEVTPHDINIIEVSPAELPRVFGHISEDHFDGSYNILRTYWELAKGPVAWRQNHGMDRIDKIGHQTHSVPRRFAISSTGRSSSCHLAWNHIPTSQHCARWQESLRAGSGHLLFHVLVRLLFLSGTQESARGC